MIDLSFLTEDEQEMILGVLKRDADLKKSEEQRIKQLQKTVRDRGRLKYLTGEWFYQTKYDRHRDRIHGSDIIRASMRQKKPVTIFELNQRWSEKQSAYGEKKDVYIPPELSGLIEDPFLHADTDRPDDGSQQNSQKRQPKTRPNPFNILRWSRDDPRPINGVKETEQKWTEEPCLPVESHLLLVTTLNTDNTYTSITIPRSLAKKRLLLYSSKEPSVNIADSGNEAKHVVTSPRRGILRNFSSSCNTLGLHLLCNSGNSSSQSSAIIGITSPETPIRPPLSPCSLRSASRWLDRKHVRFSSIVETIERVQGETSVMEEDWIPQLDQDRSEFTENGQHEPQNTLLPSFHDSSEVPDKVPELVNEGKTEKVTNEENGPFVKVLQWFGRGSQDKKQNQVPVVENVNEEHSKHQPVPQETEPLDVQKMKTPTPKPRKGLFTCYMFSNAETKNKDSYVETSDKEIQLNQTECETLCPLKSEKDIFSQQLLTSAVNIANRKAQDKHKLNNLAGDSQIERFDQDEVSPGRLTELKSFWERGNRGLQIPSSKNEEELEDGETSELAAKKYHTAPQSETVSGSVVSPSKPNPKEGYTNLTGSESFTDESVLLQHRELFSNANLLFISEDGENSLLDSLTISETTNFELESFNTTDKRSTDLLLNPEDSYQATELQEESICKDISDLKKEISNFKLSLSQREDKFTINDLKSYWEKEKGDLRHDVGPSQGSFPSCSSGKPSDIYSNITSNSSCFKEVSWLEQKEDKKKTEDKQGSENTHPFQGLQDIRGREHHITQDVSNIEQFDLDVQSSLKRLPSDGQHPQPNDLYLLKYQTPSPLHHNKVPYRDSFPNQESTKDGSPLRTFPIEINPIEKSPSIASVKSSTEHTRTTSQEALDERSIISKERKQSADSLTRFYIPLSLEHYLGLPKQKPQDESEQLKVHAGKVFKQQNPGGLSNESSPSRHSLVESEEITFDSSGSSTPEAWSISHTTLCWDSGDECSLKAALERANARPISISRSLEDLASTPKLSVVSPNTKASFLDPEQVKMMSMSVPALLQQEMDCKNSDCASESSFGRLKTFNRPSNVSTWSEVASVSSVTGSVMSIYSAEFAQVEVKGTIQFAIHYVQKLGEFHIFIVQCKDLAVADVRRNRSDPYVKCYLLPEKSKYGKKKTCVRKKTLSPSYNEILRFKVPMEMLKTQKLNVSVWHNETFGWNRFLGEVEIDLDEWDFNSSQMNEYHLKGRIQIPSSPKRSIAGTDGLNAEIKVALRFLPQTSLSNKSRGNGEVQIWVNDCKNLPISRGVSIDPFVKCAFLPEISCRSRQKTKVLKRASNPVFNHTMVFDGFKKEDLNEVCAELTVWDHDRLNNHFIGGIRLGPGKGKSYGTDVSWMDSTIAEAALWERMMQTQNEWVEDTLPLRMMVMARVYRK